jgi:hypothetical protein
LVTFNSFGEDLPMLGARHYSVALRLLFVFVCVVCGSSLAFAEISVLTTSRSVSAASTGAAGDGDSSLAAGLFDEAASSHGTSPAGDINSDADQFSFVPSLIGPVMDGDGDVSASASATGFTGFSNLADSLLDVTFTVTSTGIYNLDASVNWVGDAPPYSGFATVELHNVSSPALIDSVVSHVGSPGVHTLNDGYLLTAGVNYRLYAEAKITGGFATAGEYDAIGSWSFSLVPEPDGLALLTCGAMTLLAFTVRRSRS